MGELVEPLGFDSIWATEHYGSAYSMQPNPLQYLAYWAGRTTRVDMGTAVIVAPWWNPVRLAHEISMLDILLKGRRLHLGLGRGIAPHEYASLGYPIEQSHAYFYDVVQILRAADGAERFTFDGAVYKIPRRPSALRRATKGSSHGRSKRPSRHRPRCAWLPSMAWGSCSSLAITWTR
jgi:alkanesulfonate monooxygenase SsuD/methylene tetrahydromethanopterin reductase-like flavin-dependent oxidoreductase (luciferase family)